MSDALQDFVAQPEELRNLNSDFERAWTMVRSSVDGPIENEDEVKSQLAKILLGLLAEKSEQQDLAAKAAARLFDGR